MQFSNGNQSDNAGKTALNKLLDERYTVTFFFAVNAKKPLRDLL